MVLDQIISNSIVGGLFGMSVFELRYLGYKFWDGTIWDISLWDRVVFDRCFGMLSGSFLISVLGFLLFAVM